MEITFFGTYNKAMFLEALRLTEKQPTRVMVFRYLALGLALLIIGGSLYAWFSAGMDRSDLPQLARNIITALIIGYYYFSQLLSRQRLLNNLFRSGPERTMQGNASLEGITLGPKEDQVTIPWERFGSKGEKDKLFAMLTVDGSVAVFHRDFFATESDWQRFKQLSNQRVIEPQ
jgi:hypothetical protein